MPSLDPVRQELGRRHLAERGGTAPPVLNLFDAFEQVGDHSRHARSSAIHEPLDLQPVERTIGRCIIPAITLATRRTPHVALAQIPL